jgi:type IV secretion system protein VirB8
MWRFFRKKQTASPPQTTAPAPSSIYQEALSWETSRLQLLEESRVLAWKVALSAVGVAVLALAAVVVLLPLKTLQPYVIRVDRATGVPDIVTTLTEADVPADEVMQKYFLARYVRARETYDWHTLQADYDETRLFSSAAVGLDYAALFEGENALDKLFGASVRQTVEIQSIVPTSPTTGTVRFLKRMRRTDDPGPGIETRWVATLAFRFNSPAELTEKDRLINPFGFQVVSYRVDPELGGGAP